MQQHLQEFVDSHGQPLRIDAERGVLRGVKLLGLTSRNGRTYREAALADAVPLYEGAKVNVNHAKAGPLAPRDYQDRLGAIRDVHFRQGEGLFADLVFNPKHPLAEQLAWDAQHAPEQVGLSHNVLARTTRDGDATVVEAITKVESVDLVADPATTRGLFEHAAGDPPASLSVDRLRETRADLVEQIEQPLREQLRQVRDREARLARQLRTYELLAEYDLPLPGSSRAGAGQVTSPAFLATLAEASDEAALEERIADRAAAVLAEQPGGPSRVVSREQPLPWPVAPGVQSAKEFAAVLRG